jgi:hypothetical protein
MFLEALLIGLIVAILNGCLSQTNNLLNDLMPIAFHSESMLDSLTKGDGFTSIFNIFLGFGISLIVLKFLKKGFDTYVLWTEGDVDSDPLLVLTNFAKSIAIAICFPTMYVWLVSIVEEMTNKVVAKIGSANSSFKSVVDAIENAGLFTAIVSLIFFIVFFVLYVKFLMTGLEILILRIGLPLACVGLMDTDKGVFRTYIQKFFQSTIGVMVQIILAKLGVAVMINGHVFWGIAALLLAIKTPKFLQEFVIVGSGGGNGTQAVYQTVRLGQMLKGAFK